MKEINPPKPLWDPKLWSEKVCCVECSRWFEVTRKDVVVDDTAVYGCYYARWVCTCGCSNELMIPREAI